MRLLNWNEYDAFTKELTRIIERSVVRPKRAGFECSILCSLPSLYEDVVSVKMESCMAYGAFLTDASYRRAAIVLQGYIHLFSYIPTSRFTFGFFIPMPILPPLFPSATGRRQSSTFPSTMFD
ncbi:hypothetical protein BT96DRAFT_997873 [Gymnopus androsaceus JB14]|uniref:Uncharacterized protein n=1 Tax=Gymnopus androsaceus JB14 TaxID=1447944 RepID=A0A6A4HAB5_9AGAR|nr:hypothetical protein BT96DRAFT_997873 [Gymnopus androsaceus JB14]